MKPTKKQVAEFESIRSSGRYNMFMDALDVMDEIGVDEDTYFAILSRYSELMAEYGIERRS